VRLFSRSRSVRSEGGSVSAVEFFGPSFLVTLDFLLRLGDGNHPFPKETKQKEKKGSWPLSKVGNGTHQNQNRKEKEKRK